MSTNTVTEFHLLRNSRIKTKHDVLPLIIPDGCRKSFQELKVGDQILSNIDMIITISKLEPRSKGYPIIYWDNNECYTTIASDVKVWVINKEIQKQDANAARSRALREHDARIPRYTGSWSDWPD